MKIAVTAGAGFIGSALCTSFAAAGHEVVRLDRPDRLASLDPATDGVRPVAYELGTTVDLQGALDGADVVVHLAHKGLPSSPPEALASEAATSVRGAIDLFEAARVAGVGSVVLASSGGAVYGRVPPTPVGEDHVCEPISGYGATKLAVEDYLRYFGRAHGLRSVSLRVGNAMGPGQFRGAGVGAAAKFLALVADRAPIEIWGDGGAVRDYVYIDDIVSAFTLACNGSVPAGVYNIGSGRGATLTELVEVVHEVTGVDVDVRHLQARTFDVPSIVLDSSRFSGLTGWSATVDLRSGVEAMWAHLRSTR